MKIGVRNIFVSMLKYKGDYNNYIAIKLINVQWSDEREREGNGT